MAIVSFIAGLALLVVGAEALVKGASRIAARLGISSLIVGLTVVAFGTSSPELAVSIKAALAGQPSIALGNVIGSNIFNVLFILGLSALIIPLNVSAQLIRLDVPLLIALSVAVFLFAMNGQLGRTEGLILVFSLVGYLSFLVYQGRRESLTADTGTTDAQASTGGWGKNIALVVVGLILLILGSRWLVDSAIVFAQFMGVSELVIGLTIVAAGTSMPEVVTSVIAAIRGERDIAVGNVVGSNIFNLMGVLGIASIVSPTGIMVSAEALNFDLPIMVAVAFACLPIFFTGGVISRQEGAFLLLYYIAYTLYLILAASQHDALPRFSAVMLYFVIPITVMTMVVVLIQAYRSRSQSR